MSTIDRANLFLDAEVRGLNNDAPTRIVWRYAKACDLLVEQAYDEYLAAREA